MTAGGKHTHHQGQILLKRVDGVGYADHSPQQRGGVAHWEDGTTSYLLHTRSGHVHVHGYTIAAETDTVIQLVDAIRGGEDASPESVRNALRDIRRLRTRLEAIENEAVLYARESPDGSSGAPRLTVTEIANELDLDHSTVVERCRNMNRGKHAVWRHWLVQHTDRDDMYQGEPRKTPPPRLTAPCRGCGHVYNWHAPTGACQAEGCECDTFAQKERA